MSQITSLHITSKIFLCTYLLNLVEDKIVDQNYNTGFYMCPSILLSAHFFLLFQNHLIIIITFFCYTNSRILMSVSTEMLAKVFVGIALNLHINLGGIDIFTMLSSSL